MSRRDAFVAIADPTRREILDLLRVRGHLPAGEIANNFSDASRPGISRHLRVLKECGVVKARRDGKNQHYEIDLIPLTALREGWLNNFATNQQRSLVNLRARVEFQQASDEEAKND